jgi:tetratricopeptide (TPR) repeat protein
MQVFKDKVARIFKRRLSITSKTTPVLSTEESISEDQSNGILRNRKKSIWAGNQAPRVMIVWFEPTFFVRDDFQQIFRKLKEEYQNIHVFTDVHECVDSLSKIALDLKVYILMPGMWTTKLLNRLKHTSNWKTIVNEIFVYSSSPEQYEFLTEKYSCIRRIYASIEDVWNGIHQYIDKRCEVLRFYDQRTVRELSREDAIAEFIWFMAFKDALFQLSHDKKGKDDMVDVCQRFYANNIAQLTLINEFKSSYVSEDAPKWFSRNSFLYRLVNRALRTQDVEQLYVFRYYIRDLSSWLSNEFCKIATCKRKFFLYRGAALSKDDFQSLDRGKLLAPNGFFSTSRDIDVAKCFIGSDRSDTVRVLYEIECDMASYSQDELNKLVAFADISGNSYIADEKEVLFDLGATFEIENIEPETDENDYIIIHLTPSCEGGHLLRDYHEQCQSKIENSSAALTFGALLLKTGKYMAAQHYFEQLLTDSNDNNISDIYHYLGWTYMGRGDYGQATIHFDRAHDAIPKSDDAARARILNSIGKALVEKGFTKESLSYYQRALDLRKSCLGSKHEDVAASYANVARLYNLAGNNKLARKYYKKSLKTNPYAANSFEPSNYGKTTEETGSMICSRSSSDSFSERHHSSNYESVKNSFYELGSIQWEMGRSASGLYNMKQSLSIDKYSPTENALGPFRSFHSYGNVSPINDPKIKEITYRLRFLENTRRRHSKTDADEAKDLENVGSAYAANEKFDKALEYYSLALQLREKQGRKSQYSLDVARTLNYIGNMHNFLHQLDKALRCYRRALAIYEKFPSETNRDRLRTINKIKEITAKIDVPTATEISLNRMPSSSAPLARRSKTPENLV